MDDSLNKNLPQFPEPEFKDEFVKWIKASVGDIIPFGNTFTSIFSSFVTPKLEKRREEFFKEVAGWIWMLNKKIEEFNPNKLKDNDVFISALLQSGQIAQKTIDKRKIEFLRNATLNCVIVEEYTNFEKLQMIKLTEEISGLHYLILKYFEVESGRNLMDNHLNNFLESSNSIENLSLESFSLIVHDLERNYLLYVENKPDKVFSDMVFYVISQTALAKRLIKFISEPEIQ